MEIGGGSARGYLRGNSFQHRRGRVVAAALTRAKRIEKLEGIFAERKHAPKGSRFAVSWPTFLARGTGMAKGEEYFSYKLSRRNCRTTSGEQNANATPRRERGGWCVMSGGGGGSRKNAKLLSPPRKPKSEARSGSRSGRSLLSRHRPKKLDASSFHSDKMGNRSRIWSFDGKGGGKFRNREKGYCGATGQASLIERRRSWNNLRKQLRAVTEQRPVWKGRENHFWIDRVLTSYEA